MIAGEVEGVRGIVETTSPMAYAHATLGPAESMVFDVPDGHTALVHVFVGSAAVNGVDGDEGVMVVGDRSSGAMSITAGPNGCDVLLLSGEPLLEPIARYGPFVMNTREEIIQAFDDYEAGRLGRIVATGSGVSR